MVNNYIFIGTSSSWWKILRWYYSIILNTEQYGREEQEISLPNVLSEKNTNKRILLYNITYLYIIYLFICYQVEWVHFTLHGPVYRGKPLPTVIGYY